MSTLTILRGISGSGKSTWARMMNDVVVSRDDLRTTFFPNFTPEEYYKSPLLRDMEETITRIQDATISALLQAGKDVIVDNTNIEWKYVKALAKVGYDAGADVRVKVFDVSLPTAIARVKARAANGGLNVDEAIIRKQHGRLQGTKDKQLVEPVEVKPYHGTPGKPKAFLVDVDGTLAHMHNRSPYDWKRVGEDHVDEVVSEIVSSLNMASYMDDGPEWSIIVMSGRDGSCRAETSAWLFENHIPFDHLFMRDAGDMRRDDIVKAELFDKYVRDNFDVKFVLDDRDQVVRMWRKMGLTCLQVAEGDF